MQALCLPPMRDYLRSAAWDQRRLVEGACVIKLLSKYHQECLNMVKYVLMSHHLHIYIYLKHLNSEKLIDPLGDESRFHFDGILLWNDGEGRVERPFFTRAGRKCRDLLVAGLDSRGRFVIVEIQPLALKEDGVIVSCVKRLRIDLKKLEFLVTEVDGGIDRTAICDKQGRLFRAGAVFKQKPLGVALTLEYVVLTEQLYVELADRLGSVVQKDGCGLVKKEDFYILACRHILQRAQNGALARSRSAGERDNVFFHFFILRKLF